MRKRQLTTAMIHLRLLIIMAVALVSNVPAHARDTYNFNPDWTISLGLAPSNSGDIGRQVTLPHAWNEDEAFRVGIAQLSDTIAWYSKTFELPDNIDGKRVFIEFEGVRQAATVWVNGDSVGMHENGVMAFAFDITPYIRKGENKIDVRTDNSWDYREQSTGTPYQWNNKNFNANYGGIIKNVWLHITDNVYQTLPLYSNLGTTGVYIYAKDIDVQARTAIICVECEVRNESDMAVARSLDVAVKDIDGNIIREFSSDGSTEIPAHGTTILKASAKASDLHFWSWGYGYLYDVTTTVGSDEVTTKTGFRKTEFKDGMIYLNDRVIMIHGYAQRTSNEWPGVGMSVPPWLSDYSNDMFVKGGGNLVRWMHVAPWKQDVESCDRVGLMQAMPAGDAEKDVNGRQWEHREALMRDAIIYYRNNPSIIFYECGNKGISEEHMLAMKAIRDEYDPHGGRAIGCREMLDSKTAEYGGEMLYVNKSDTKPMWMMEYCRDEALRWYWNSWSYPYHAEGEGPLYRNAPADAYNHNQDEFAAQLVERWYEYWLERPGSGTKVNSGGTKIIFSDTQTHGRSADNYRVSGVVDPMRVPKDAYYAHQVMWDCWVDDLEPRTYIVGHWNYTTDEVIPTIYVVSTADSVVLRQGDRTFTADEHKFRFLNVFKNIPYLSDTLIATTNTSADTLITAGKPAAIKLSLIENPTGWKADGADIALVEVEITDAYGQRCPLDNRLITFELEGAAEWRGGIAKGIENHVLCDTLPVECGVNRVMLRSLPTPGKVTLKASAEGLQSVTLTTETMAVDVVKGLSKQKPADGLQCVLDRGETPSSPSFTQWRRGVEIVSASTPKNDPALSYDKCENTTWESSAVLDSAYITYTLAEEVSIDDICLKMKGFRATTYPIAVYAGDVKVWEGWTPKALSYIHIPLKDTPPSRTYTIRSLGPSTTKDAFGAVKELDSRNDEEKLKGNNALKIIEIEFLKEI